MGFLSGVLGAVKDDPSVTTYYKGMETTLEKIKNSMHTPDGLSKAVDAVSGALREWDGELTSRTENVRNAFNALSTSKMDIMNSALNDLNADNPDKVANHLDNCILRATELGKAYDDAEQEYKKLDKPLKDKLKDLVNNIKVQVKSFVEAATNTELRATVETAKGELESLKEKVDEKSEGCLKNMVNRIDGYFTVQIKDPINAVRRALASVDTDLNKWIERAKEIAKYGIEQAGKILEEAKEKDDEKGKPADSAKNWQDVISQATALKDKAQKLYDAASQAKTQIPTLVKTAKEAIEPFEQVYHEELKRIKKAVNAAVEHIQNRGLKELDDKVKAGLKDLKGKFKDPIEKYFKKVENALKEGVNEVGVSATFLPQEVLLKLADKGKLHRWIMATKDHKLGGPLAKLDGAGRFKDFKDFLQQFLQVEDDDGKTFFGIIGADITEKVKAKIMEYEISNDRGEFKQLMAAYDGWKNTNIAEKVKQIKTDVEMNFKDGLNSTKLDEVEANKIDLKGSGKSKREELEDTINDITTNVVEGHLKNVGSDAADGKEKIAGNTFDDMLTQVEKTLSQLMSAIRNLTENTIESEKPKQRKGVKNYFEELQLIIQTAFGEDADKATKSLEGIKDRIEKILGANGKSNPDGNLKEIVSKAEQFKETVIDKEADAAIESIKEYVEEQVAVKIRNIQGEARTQYHSKVNGVFKTMKAKVGNYISKINEIIGEDLRTGVKGLLRKVMDHGNKNRDDNNMLKKLKNKKFVKDLASPLKDYLKPILSHVENEVKTAGTTSPTKQENERSNKVNHIHGRVGELLRHFGRDTNINNFDDKFVTSLLTLKCSLADLSAPRFSGYQHPLLLDSLKNGLMRLCEELDKAYVNTYAGREIKEWVSHQNGKSSLTVEGGYVARVFLTIIEIVNGYIFELRDGCKQNWFNDQMNQSAKLGKFLKRCGYIVPKRGDQNGELRNKAVMQGKEILRSLEGTVVFTSHTYNLMETLETLHGHLEDYYSVGHTGTAFATRVPCNVYEILVWLAGLTYNSVYQALCDDIFQKLYDPKKHKTETHEDIDLTVVEKKALCMDAYPTRVTYDHIITIIQHICSTSHDVLTTIVGTGDEYTTYAVDCCNNSLKFKYPTSGEDCLYTLLELLRRLFPPLKFLYSRCNNTSSDSGWADCNYGKDIASGKSQCKDHSDVQPKCQANCQPKCQAKGQVNCQPNCQANCQPTSPLMSYLNDCLPGHLPHDLTAVGCSPKCNTCPKGQPGMPCITPLGFRGFSCSTRTGKELRDIIGTFLNFDDIFSIFCFASRPPSSLPEHFGFALYFVRNWSDGKKAIKPTTQSKFESSIGSQSISLYSETQKLIDALRNAYGSTHTNVPDKPHLSQYADLSSLSIATPCNVPQVKCAPYLVSLCSDSYRYFADKHANLYLSWATYLPWTFWSYLNGLYKAFCDIYCQDWGCRNCLHGSKCRRGQHGLVEVDEKKTEKPHCQCKSIVDCKGVAPTLYQFGFVFGEASTLNGESPKRCSDFSSQLKNVLTSKYFENLFTECDMFLWKIREPFSYLVLALWLLSLLYLLHIMVIRLDLLHIKSHLHSPSSHRIAAQSLLAAGRVNKLGKVFYLQP